MSKERLFRRIEERADRMLRMGLLEEIERLLQMGFESFLTSQQAIGYKEFIPCVKGLKALEECSKEMIRNTKEQAKRQIRWFRKQGWIELNMERLSLEQAVEEVALHLRAPQG